MTDHDHDPDFDEALISGYLDGELTQGDRQRVRLHLEDCPACAAIADDLRDMKELTMTTGFHLPPDTQWDERPRTTTSRILQYLGWGLAAAWAVGLAALLIWQAVADRESARFDAVVGLAPLLAIALIVASAGIDRWQTRKADPYRKVQK